MPIRQITWFLAAALVLLIPATASAYCDAQRCKSRIRLLYPHSDMNQLMITVHEPATELAKLNCKPLDGAMLVLKPSQPLFREMYSTLLAAAHARAVVTLRIRETPGATCEIAYVMHEFQ